MSKLQLPKLSHHAYALIGGETVQSELIGILENEYAIKMRGNQDFFNKSYVNFTIDDAREIKSLHSTRPVVEGGKKIFILKMDSITVEAQNAMLKLLEEPSEYAHFFLIIPSAHLLLPTIKSRMQILNVGNRSDHSKGGSRDNMTGVEMELFGEAKKFMKSSLAKRLEIIKGLMDGITKEKKTKQDAIDFLNAVQSVIYEQRGVKDGMRDLEAVEIARKYMNDRSPSLKTLLEYVALNID